MTASDGRLQGGGNNNHAPGVLRENSFHGGGRDDLFPLPTLSWRRRRVRTSSTLTGAGDESWGFSRRQTGRISEAVTSLNGMAAASAVSARRGAFVDGHQSTGAPTRAQSSALKRLASGVRNMGGCPVGMNPKDCFQDILKSKDLYSLSSTTVAPYNPDLLKVTKSATVPKEATSLLPPTEAEYILDPSSHILRSQSEIDAWTSENRSFQPYWDESLRRDRSLRLELYRQLHRKSLLSFRKNISAKVGLFFVWKASRKGIRMIVDARMTNACHRSPPRTRLGGATALSEVDAFVEGPDLECPLPSCGGLVELPTALFGDTADVSDAFYQFSVWPLAEWFGLDDPIVASEFNISQVWCATSQSYVDVEPHEKLFPVFTGMPQGWSWALHLCNTAVEYGMSKSIPPTRFVKEGLPPPDPRQGPIGSVYVDNIGVFGFVEKMVHHSFAESIEHLEQAGFVLHELERGLHEISNVGIVLHTREMKIRHSKKRSWRLYLALKHLLRLKKVTSEALRMIAGHIVHYFSICRPGLSCLHHVYKFIYRWLDGKAHVLPGSVKRELRMIIGLIPQVEVDMASPYNDTIYCGDSSSYGYCVQVSPSDAAEQRELFRFHERWRFVQVEEGIGVGLGSHHGWSAEFEMPDLAYVRWLCDRLGIPHPATGQLEAGTAEDDRPNKHSRRFQSVDLVGLVPTLPDTLLAPSRWQTVIKRLWKHAEAIHMKEGRVALMGLRRAAKDCRTHGKRLLCLCDNLAAVCAFDKGRAKDLSLLALCRRAGALQICTRIRWHLRYVESARNPSRQIALVL